MEKFFLSFFFSGQELDIVKDKDVYCPIFFLEALHVVVLDRRNNSGGKFFSRNIFHFFPGKAFDYGIA